MCLKVMLSVWRRLQLCVQSGGQYFESLCKVANLRFRQEEHQLAFFKWMSVLQKVRRFCELVFLPVQILNWRLSTDSRSIGRRTGRMAADGTACWAVEQDLAAHFGCDGDKDLPDAVFQFTDIAIQLHGQFYHMRALKIRHSADTSPVF